MEHQLINFFKGLMDMEKNEQLNISDVLNYIKESNLDEDMKVFIRECTEEHIGCENERNEEIADGNEDVYDEKTLTVSPYGGCYTLECEWCNSVVVDIESLLEELEECED